MGAAPPPPRVPGRAVWWHAPFFSGSGMGTEALQLVLGLDKYTEYTGRCEWGRREGGCRWIEALPARPHICEQNSHASWQLSTCLYCAVENLCTA